MKTNGKSKKGKSPRKSHSSLIERESAAQPLTITEMFKRHSVKKPNSYDGAYKSVNVTDDDVEENDDVVFVGEDAVSPYFKATSLILKKEHIEVPAGKSTTVLEPRVLSKVRKRKLSLVKNSVSSKCVELTHSRHSSEKCENINDNNVMENSNKRKRSLVKDNDSKTRILNVKQRGSKIGESNIVSVDLVDVDPESSEVSELLTKTEDDQEERTLVKFAVKKHRQLPPSKNSEDSRQSSTSEHASPSKRQGKETTLDMSCSPILPEPDPPPNIRSAQEMPSYKKPGGELAFNKAEETISANSENGFTSNTINTVLEEGERDVDISQAGKSTSQEVKGEKDLSSDRNTQEDNVSSTEGSTRTPYYLNNFETLLNSVMTDESNKKLFNDEDLLVITIYHQLSDGAKKLYIRMFGRKLHWIPLSKLNYPEIAEDLMPYLKELSMAGFIDCDEQLNNLEEVLGALSAGDIKTLAKSYHVTSAVSQKNQLVQELMKKSHQNTLSTMFGSTSGGVAKGMLIRAKKYLNGIYRLRLEPRGVFVRAMMLFSLVNTSFDEDSGTGGQGQLFQMLMVNMGKVTYPTYEVNKVHSVFQDREDLIRFEAALQLETELLSCTERGHWEQAYIVYQTVEKEWTALKANVNIEEWNSKLPEFLRCYTATSVIHRLLSASVEILQRRKDYPAAVELLQRLLSEYSYNSSHRGYMWERLALNLDAHIKQSLESLEVVLRGLADERVRVGHRLALYLRAESICQRPKLKIQHRLEEFHHPLVGDTPKVFIEGRVLHQGVSANGTMFLTDESYMDGNSEDMTVLRVEEYVLKYYRKNGFPSGIHAEGSIVSTLFALFFWDILFMSVPDVFHSPFQSGPLDLATDNFYMSRRDTIELRLAQLKESSVLELQSQAEETWTSYEGVACVGVSWERVTLAQIKELLSCMGGKILSGLIGRYARCPRHTRSGFPDLTLWNTQTGALKICEVKGPGDRLSHKQILWIDYLVRLGVDAEVCHVKAVAAKKLKPSS